MEFDYVVIYKQTCGAKYGCIAVEARNSQEAKAYAFNMYSYIINESTFVKVVKIGK